MNIDLTEIRHGRLVKRAATGGPYGREWIVQLEMDLVVDLTGVDLTARADLQNL